MATIEETTQGQSVRAALARARNAVTPALRAAIDTLPPSMHRVAGLHFGWWDEHGQPVQADSGKALRPTLVVLAAEAVGGNIADAIPAAVAVELVHNFSLLHDDVMDGDITRRHRPAAWTVFGLGPAILAGDALLTLAFDVLAASGHTAAEDSIRTLNTAVVRLVEGQSVDIAFERRQDVEVAECISMAERKTGALLGCACDLGAAFGGGSPSQIEHLRAFGERLGLAFQHVDDLLGIWGDPAITGKPVHSDLSTRKKSLPVVAALNSGTAAGEELGELYCQEKPLTGAELVRAADLVEAAGGRQWSQEQADELLADCTRHLQLADPADRAAEELGSIARLATRRDH